MLQYLEQFKYLVIKLLTFFPFLLADSLRVNGSFHLSWEVIIKAMYFKDAYDPFCKKMEALIISLNYVFIKRKWDDS